MALTQRDVGSEVALWSGGSITAFCSTSTAVEGVAQTGNTLDRLGLGRRYLSVKVGVVANGQRGTATSYAHSVQGVVGLADSADGTNFTNFSTDRWGSATVGNIYNTASTPAASTSTSTSWNAVFDARFDLTRARRYIRPVFTGTVVGGSSAAGPDTLAAGIFVLALGGAEILPTT